MISLKEKTILIQISVSWDLVVSVYLGSLYELLIKSFLWYHSIVSKSFFHHLLCYTFDVTIFIIFKFAQLYNYSDSSFLASSLVNYEHSLTLLMYCPCLHWPCYCTAHVYVVIHWPWCCTVHVYVVIHWPYCCTAHVYVVIHWPCYCNCPCSCCWFVW